MLMHYNVHYSMDCARKWIGTVQNISSSTVRSRDKIARVSSYGYSSVLSLEVDESTILPAAGSRCSVSPLEV